KAAQTWIIVSMATMGPILSTSILTLPTLLLLAFVPFYDETGSFDSRNGMAGLRTQETLASREAWDAAHAWAKVPMRRLVLVMAGVLGVSIAAEFAFGLSEVAQGAVVLAQAAIFMTGLGVIGWRAHKVAARVNRELADQSG